MALVASVQNIDWKGQVADAAAEVAKCQRLYESLKVELKNHMKSFDRLIEQKKEELEEFPDMPSQALLEMDKIRPYRLKLMSDYHAAYYSLTVAKWEHELQEKLRNVSE